MELDCEARHCSCSWAGDFDHGWMVLLSGGVFNFFKKNNLNKQNRNVVIYNSYFYFGEFYPTWPRKKGHCELYKDFFFWEK